MDRKRKKDPTYQLASTARWVVSPEAESIIRRLEKKRARKAAWIERKRREQGREG